MSTLILVRHGQSVWNPQNRFTCWVDVSLSSQGMYEFDRALQLIDKQVLTTSDRACHD